ncbi:MAG: DUF4166 domain-containing protein [Candidatus Leucobacter sulfamidivorax]|nr:DUF4166 domain-containing protein [Candidatus Leucobacter sulfamidivorax]
MTLLSPYESALGERIHRLHPVAQRYFSAIPAGCVGVGEGVFEEFGTPRRWLRPLLRPLERRGVLVAGYVRDVPFRIENRTVAVPEGGGSGVGTVGAAVARRTIDLPTGPWETRDSVIASGGGVLERLGAPWTVSTLFEVGIDGSADADGDGDGALTLVSRRVGLVIGRLRVRIPRFIAPVVRLREGYDEASGMQRVEVTMDLPFIGRIYGYRGGFSYRIEEARDDRD